jgi:general secretion pathway protein D
MFRGKTVGTGILFATLIGGTIAHAQAPVNALGTKPPEDKPIPCSQSVAGPCIPTKDSRKKAEKIYKKGLSEANKKNFEQAFDDFSMAAKLAPDNTQYLTQREQTRQRMVQQLIADGNQFMLDNHELQALALFQKALKLDPDNEFARQRIYDAMPPMPSVRAETIQSSNIIELKPSPQRRRINLQGPAPTVLESMAKTFGITSFVDSSVPSTPVSLNVDNVTWDEASDIVCRMTKTFWTPLAPNQVLFAKDDDATRRTLQRVALTTFYLSTNTPQELNDLSNTLRVLFDIRFIITNPAQNTIAIRAPQPVVEAATRFIEQLDSKRPQVLLEVQVYAIAQDLTRQIGVDIPNSFTIFNVPTEVQKLLGNQSIQSIIDQITAAGGINQAAAGGLAALLAQGLSGGATSPLQQPFATFGGGQTLTGITTTGFAVKLSVNDSTFHSLQKVSVRASQGNPATIKIGQRYPIVTASYSPTFNNPAASALINAGGSVAIPSIQYEDLGINVKATPKINREGVVFMEVEMSIRSLQGTAQNGIPILANREFKATVSTRDGESVGVAGLISKSEQKNLSGIPGLSQLPGGNYLVTDNSRTINDDEVLVVITPHIVGGVTTTNLPAIALPSFIQR